MPHAEDGLLVQFLDGECDADERQQVEGHLDDCAVCSARLSQLHQRSDAVHAALLVWDEESVRRRGGLPVWFRAAAAILILLGIAGGVRPVRAWIVDGAQAIWSVLAGGEALPDATQAPGEPLQSSGSVVFTPPARVFRLELTSRQVQGTVLIETTDRATAEAEIIGGTGTEDLVVLPSGLRIVNGETSRARYVVRLPRQLAVVRVVVAAESTLALEPAGTSSRWEIDLAPPGRQAVPAPRR